MFFVFCFCFCFPVQVFVLLFIFVKRQIMRFVMRSRRGPHAPIGHNAPKVKRVSSFYDSVCVWGGEEVASLGFGTRSWVCGCGSRWRTTSRVCFYLSFAGSEGGDRLPLVQSPGDMFRASSPIRRRRAAEAGVTDQSVTFSFRPIVLSPPENLFALHVVLII